MAVDSSQWQSLSKKGVPGRLNFISNKPGWVNALNVQGVGFDAYDHYAVEELKDGSGGIRVTVWNDDPKDWPEGDKHARVVTILPLAPDERFGGAWNTKQFTKIFTQPQAMRFFGGGHPVENTEFLLWERFREPPEHLVRHGIWLKDKLFDRHIESQTLHGWREWTEGVPMEFLDVWGRVTVQARLGLRSPRLGTLTYYGRDTNRAIGAYAATHEDAFESDTGTAGSEEVSLPPADPATSILGWTFSTPANKPNNADWPNGTYKCQLDCTANSGVNYGLLTVGAENGKFARVSSDLASELESTVQAEAVFTNSGLKLATVSWNPTAGAAGDRFVCVVACQSTSIHAVKAMTLKLNEADDYAEGPWPAAAGQPTPVRTWGTPTGPGGRGKWN